ncbi:MAG: L-asparaginase [Ramlibacter sp.]|nr:L-asparaginase [Ramlibacter sp.]
MPNHRQWMLSLACALSLLPAATMAQPASAPGKVLPRVIVLSTGGTIAGSSRSSTDTTNYVSGQKSGNELVQAVPEIAAIADVTVDQVANVKSPDLTNAHLLVISKAVSKYLADESVSGVVITHGTSTLEETAIFLELTVKSDKPVVVVGAMRPATAISADGPFNLLQAIALAASPQARGRGVMIVANDRIGSAMYTTKTNTLAVDTFRAAEQGMLGVFVGPKPRFFYAPAKVPGQPKFDISATSKLPKVDIVYGYLEEDDALLDFAIRNGARGVIVAGTGNSSLSDAMTRKVAQLTLKGFPVVRASRVGSGFASEKSEGIGAGFYNPQKARMLLALAINQGADLETIRSYFIPRD